MAPYRPILRYTVAAISRDTFGRRLALPQNGTIPPPWYLVPSRHICARPHFATYRAGIVRFTIKTSTKEFFWCAGTTPILKKTLRECRGKWKSFGWVRGNSGIRSESCSENCGFRIDQVVRGHSENGISYSENGINFQFRELLREYPGTLRELREWPFHSESVFPEIGVVPRLLGS